MRINVAKIQPRITRRDDRVYGIINYDKTNAYPQDVDNIVGRTGQGFICVNTFYKFVNGKGFDNVNFGKMVIDGKKLTADKLLRKNAFDFTRYGGFAIHFNYNMLGQVTTVHPVPFSHCRLAIDEKTSEVVKIAVYDDWARERKKAIDKKEIDYIHLYNPDPERVKEEIELAGGIEFYKGQIYYHGAEGDLVYPVAPYDSELEDMATDGEIKIFKWKSISSSFMAANMIVKYGQSEGGNKGTGSTAPPLAGERATSDTTDQDEAFVEGIKQFQGAENYGKSLVAFIDTPEQKPEIIPFPVANVDKLFEYTETSTQDNIRKVFTIPTIYLDAISKGLNGLSKELEDAVTFYNVMTSDERALIEEAYQSVLGNVYTGQNFKIKELSMTSVIQPDKLIV